MKLITSLPKSRAVMAVLVMCGTGLALSGCSDFRKACLLYTSDAADE